MDEDLDSFCARLETAAQVHDAHNFPETGRLLRQAITRLRNQEILLEDFDSRLAAMIQGH